MTGPEITGEIASREEAFEVIPPPWHVVEGAVEAALAEDLGLAGDLTTSVFTDPDAVGYGRLVFRQDGVLAGTWTTEAVCGRFDLMVTWLARDGDVVAAGEAAAELEGRLADMLTAERTILNFLTHLSGIATLTRRFVVAASSGGPAVIRDTRKTTPGLRGLEKAAVRAGGARNHRMGLYDAVLVKDNHLAGLIGDEFGNDVGFEDCIAAAIARSRDLYPGVPVEVEADRLDQAVAAAAAGADLVLADNMAPGVVAEVVDAVAKAVGRAVPVEVSGGVTLDNVADYAAAGATYIAVGALTHSAPAVDIGLDLSAADVDESEELDEFGRLGEIEGRS